MSFRIDNADAHPHELADRLSLARTGYAVIGLAALGLLFMVLPHAQAAGIALVVVIAVGFKAAMTFLESKIDSKIAAEKRATLGAVAEQPIGEILSELGDEHLILHDIACPFGNIDHVILSKTRGIFLVEAKAHGGHVAIADSRVLVNGRLPEMDFVVQTLRNTHWLAAEIEKVTGVCAPVQSLVVFTNAFVVTSRSVKGVTITNQKFLLPNIHRQGKPLAPEVWAAREKIATVLSGARMAAAA